jgi:hypothetical protein
VEYRRKNQRKYIIESVNIERLALPFRAEVTTPIGIRRHLGRMRTKELFISLGNFVSLAQSDFLLCLSRVSQEFLLAKARGEIR